jgi:hypothetical protein
MDLAETKIHDHYMIFSGVFTFPEEILYSHDSDLGADYVPWYNRLGKKEREGFFRYVRSYYYSSFLIAAFPEAESFTPSPKDVSGSLTGRRTGRKRMIHLTLSSFIEGGEGEWKEGTLLLSPGGEQFLPFAIDYVDLYLYPSGVGIVALKCRIRKEEVTFQDLSDFTFHFREFQRKNLLPGAGEGEEPISVGEFIHEVVLGPSSIPSREEDLESEKFNNKLKCFFVLEGDLSAVDEMKVEELLFELGTVSRIGTVENGGAYAPSEKYFRGILSDHSVSVFNNWKALSLFDTFLGLFSRVDEKKGVGAPFYNFESLYFPIYCNALFLKFSLFTFNRELSRVSMADSHNRVVRDRFIEFHNRYYFSHVAYNFLPNLFYRKMLDSLDVDAEIQQLEDKIEKVNTYVNEKQDRRTNIILGLLSLFTMGSAFWDTSEWFQKLFQIPESTYTVFSLALAGGVGVLIVLLFLILGKRLFK